MLIEIKKDIKEKNYNCFKIKDFFITYELNDEIGESIFNKNIVEWLKNKHQIIVNKKYILNTNYNEKDLVNELIQDTEEDFFKLYEKRIKKFIKPIENNLELKDNLNLLVTRVQNFIILQYQKELFYTYFQDGIICYFPIFNYIYEKDLLQNILNKKDTILEDAKKNIKDKVIGQDKIVDNLLHLVEMRKNNFFKINEYLLGCVMFLGDTGTGKTELGKVTSEEFFLIEPLIIDCNTLTHPDLIANTLFGSGKGFVDSNLGGLLSNKTVKEKVIIFDEIEKAHPSIFTIIMNILDRGYIFDLKTNEKIIFSNSLIVLTSNLLRIESNNIKKELIEKGIAKEVIARIDEFYFFQKSFSKEDLKKIALKSLINSIKMFPNKHLDKTLKYFVDQDKILEKIDEIIDDELNFGIRELRNNVIQFFQKKYYQQIEEKLKSEEKNIEIIFN